MGFEAVQMAASGRHAEALAMVRTASTRIREEHAVGRWPTLSAQLDLAEARILRTSGDLDAALIKARGAFDALTGRVGDEDMLSMRHAS